MISAFLNAQMFLSQIIYCLSDNFIILPLVVSRLHDYSEISSFPVICANRLCPLFVCLQTKMCMRYKGVVFGRYGTLYEGGSQELTALHCILHYYTALSDVMFDIRA